LNKYDLKNNRYYLSGFAIVPQIRKVMKVNGAE